MKLHIDYETRAEIELKKVGSLLYAKHPATEIMCIGYKIDDGPTEIWWPHQKFPILLDKALREPRCTIVAHNAGFEQNITNYTLSRRFKDKPLPYIIPNRFSCTAARAAAMGLPRHLAGACAALELAVQKDMGGHRLMLKYCKPARGWAQNGEGKKWHDNAEELERLGEYCKTDVDAEYLLDKALPELIPDERVIWALNQSINTRGLCVDIPLIKKILSYINIHHGELIEELKDLTGGEVDTANKRDKLLSWLFDNGVDSDTLRAGDVENLLTSDKIDKNSKAFRVLQIRQEAGKSSTNKYKAFLQRADAKGIIGDILKYYGAHTGRFSGEGIQPQNFPRGTLKNVDTAIDVIMTEDFDTFKLIYNRPLDVFSSCLRGVIKARPGKELFCADFAQIEVRVLFWVAKHDEGLKIFAGDGKIYEGMAARIFRVKISDVTKLQRQLGKAAILGCGYNMGPKKFLETCLLQKIEITKEQAELAVSTYREVHAPVKDLWGTYEKAALYALDKKGYKIKVNKVAWVYDGKWLRCELPSGRAIYYYDPKIEMKKTLW